MAEGNGWSEYKRSIMNSLDQLHATCRRMEDKLDKENKTCADDRSTIKGELAVLKYKSTLWASLAAAIPIVAFMLWRLVS